MSDQNGIRGKIREFVLENFLMGDTTAMLKDKDSFLETGTIDSTGVLEVVTFIETEFNLKVADSDLVPENMDSIENITKYVERKAGNAPK